MVDVLVHFAFVLLLPPLLPGVINRVKATFAGRQGQSVFQLYYDLAKLLRRGWALSTTTTWVFRAGPVVGLAALLVASLVMPLGQHSAPVSFAGDLILFAYLMGLVRYFTTAAALDTGSPFEGMGAAREATFACLAEPALFFGLFACARLTGKISLTGILNGLGTLEHPMAAGALVLVAVGWFIVMLAEACRIPFDDPNTHLELTMIHEVMVLDHSGPAFGAILYAAALKLFLLEALILPVALPISTGNRWIDWLGFAGGLVLLALIVGVVESTMARLRLVNVPKLLVSACLLCAFAAIMLLG